MPVRQYIGGMEGFVTIQAVADSQSAFVSVTDTPYSADNSGNTDVSGAFQTALNAIAGTGQTLWVPAGKYLFTNPLAVPSKVTIMMDPAVQLISSMTFTGHQTNTIFFAQFVKNANAGTLHTAPTVGTASISIDMPTAPTVGNALAVSNTLSESIYDIISVVGVASPYTVTLDRPVVFPFQAGGASVVQELTSYPHDIRIFANGATATGTGDRLVEFAGVKWCYVDGLHYNTSGGALGDMGMSIDTGFESGFTNCHVDMTGAGASVWGISLESTERCFIQHCVASNCPAVGLYMVDSFGSIIQDSHHTAVSTSYGTGGSILIGTDGASLGNYECIVSGCTTVNGKYGCVINSGQRTKFSNCAFEYAGTNGLLFNGTGIGGTEFDQVSLFGCAGTAFVGGSSNTDTVCRGVNFGGAAGACLSTGSDIDLIDCMATGLSATMTAFLFSGGNKARVIGFDYAHSGISNVLRNTGVARLEVDGASISMGASSIALLGGFGVIHADRVVTSGSGTATKGIDLTSCTGRIGEGCDFSSCATAISLHASGFVNRKQTVIANGVTGVDVSWTDIKATDMVLFTLQTIGGTVGHPKYTITPGVKFTLTSDASDTSTYEYFIP